MDGTVRNVIKGTVLEGADSWYVGTNVPGKAKGIVAYASDISNYIKACDRVAQNGYGKFHFAAG